MSQLDDAEMPRTASGSVAEPGASNAAPPARPSEPVTDVSRLRASELARLPRAVWEPVLAAAAERAAEAYRTDPEFSGLEANCHESQFLH